MKTEVTTLYTLCYISRMLSAFPLPVFVMFWLGFIWAVELSIAPYILKVILNLVAQNSNINIFELLATPVLCYMILNIVMATSYRLYDYFVNIKMIPDLRSNMANEALGLLIDKSHNYFQNNFSGSLANKINDLTSSVPDIIHIGIDRSLGHGLALVFSIIVLWQVDFRFAIFTLIWSVIFVAGAFYFANHFARLAADWSQHGSTITGKLVDVLSNVLSVRLFISKTTEKKSLAQVFQSAVNAERKLQWSFLWMWIIYGYSYCMLLGLNFYFLIQGRQEGWVSIGDFALVLGLNIAIANFLWEVAQDFSKFSKYLGRITQALKTIFEHTDLVDAPNATQLTVTHGRIDFKNVKFHYKENDELFKNKSVTIESGQKVGLVGYSGGGKSTFVNLILRLYDVTCGQILIDGQNIKHVTQDSLRASIGMIPQDPSLFHRSLMDNIRYGCINATDDRVIEAAKRAHAHEFITKQPQGYNSLVGERGVKLSGGQRQRIAIARAILKNAPILILDEATSQLDSVTESHIQNSLWKLMQGKTAIVIAHRLSTLLHMDRILVFDNGKIMEDGTHQELLAKGGLYKTLWNAQVGGFLVDEVGE